MICLTEIKGATGIDLKKVRIWSEKHVVFILSGKLYRCTLFVHDINAVVSGFQNTAFMALQLFQRFQKIPSF